mgnify:CR=1 FL=1
MTIKDDLLVKIVWGCETLENSFEIMPYSLSSYDLETLRLHDKLISFLINSHT